MDFINRDDMFQLFCNDITEQENQLKEDVSALKKLFNTESAVNMKKQLNELNLKREQRKIERIIEITNDALEVIPTTIK